VRLNYGSLYSVVEALERRGLIAPREAEREGRRPERTVYELTEAGQVELVDWMTELLSTPVKEYPQFEAALSFMPALPPGDVAGLLRERAQRLQLEIAHIDATLELAHKQRLPRLFLVEDEYRRALREAELAYVEQLAHDIETNTLEGVDFWREIHEQGAFPTWNPPEE
jgi:DNA-binding PadR family transcriptional regulator